MIGISIRVRAQAVRHIGGGLDIAIPILTAPLDEASIQELDAQVLEGTIFGTPDSAVVRLVRSDSWTNNVTLSLVSGTSWDGALPTDLPAGVYTLTIRATYGGTTLVSAPITLTVTEYDDPPEIVPTATAPAGGNLIAGATITSPEEFPAEDADYYLEDEPGADTYTFVGNDENTSGDAVWESALSDVVAIPGAWGGQDIKLKVVSRVAGGLDGEEIITVPVTYYATGVDLDGTNDRAARGADLTGIADGKEGIVSFWARLDAGSDGINMQIMGHVNTAGLYINRNSSNKWSVQCRNAAGTQILNMFTNNNYTVGATWYNILISWKLDTGVYYLYVNDVADKVGSSSHTNDTIDYTRGDFSIGATVTPSRFFNGCLSEIFFHTSFLDISVEANRRKFISAAGKPVSLGADGSTPLGVQPLLYAPNGNPLSNLGSGGNFTVFGTFDAASTSPSL